MRFSSTRALFLAVLISLFISAAPQTASAQLVELELVLIVDISGSISDADFNLQNRGYANAFRSQAVKNLIAQLGGVAVTLIYTADSPVTAIPATLVEASTADAFATRIEAQTRPFRGNDAMHLAIDHAVNESNRNSFRGRNVIFDVSANGISDFDLTFAAQRSAIRSGDVDVINGLQIGNFGSLRSFFGRVTGGPGHFIEIATNFADLERAILAKMTREISSVAPDNCPNSSKTDPGICGCNVPDTDSDGDGTVDCVDACPNDATKTSAGACGCGTPDIDSNNDGTPDCADQCPNDPAKTAPGSCGCGTPDTDSDADGTPDCMDQCANDDQKVVPGGCGCGVPDVDRDTNGILDCNEECGLDPAITLRDGLTTSTESLARIGIRSAKRLARLANKVNGQSGLGRDADLDRFGQSSRENIRKTVAEIEELLEQQPEIYKPCPGPTVCSTVDNFGDKQRLIRSINKLRRLVSRITTRLFFFRTVENPDGSRNNKVTKKKKRRARSDRSKTNREIREVYESLRLRIQDIPDTVTVCE